MTEDDIFISIIDSSMEERFFESEITTNFEIALFAQPRILDHDLDNTIARVKEVLDKHPIRKAIHGPVMDLTYDSRDPKVQEVSAFRIRQGIYAAAGIGAEVMVAHSSYNPYFECSNKYREEWVRRSAEFWKPLVEEAAHHSITIVIENIFDQTPELIKQLLDTVRMPYFKASIDVGHLNLFSRASIDEWVSTYGNDLVHTHLHNNHGVLDEHAGLDDGTFDIDAFFSALKKYSVNPSLTLEMRDRTAIEPGIDRIKALIET